MPLHIQAVSIFIASVLDTISTLSSLSFFLLWWHLIDRLMVRGWVIFSVTRFGVILPLWQHFINLYQMVQGLFNVWQIFEPTLANCVFGPAFNVVKGQILKNNLAIWSHWLFSTRVSSMFHSERYYLPILIFIITIHTRKYTFYEQQELLFKPKNNAFKKWANPGAILKTSLFKYKLLGSG